MRQIKIFAFIFLIGSVFFYSCEKQFDLPPLKQVPEGAKLTIATIKTRYNPFNIYKFKGDTNLYCVVTADESSGNLYKEIYVKDATGGLHLRLINSGGLFIGDSIRINLNNLLLNSSADLIQLDSVDTDNNVVKLASGLDPQPINVSIQELLANTTPNNKFQSRLIQLNGVEFLSAHQNQPYANAVTKAAVQYTIQDCEKNQLALRTSGYCYFASQKTPSGNGSIVGICSQFNNIVQLILRTADEVKMTGILCQTLAIPSPTGTIYLSKNFEDGIINSGDWLNINAIGTVSWTVKTSTNTSNPTKFAECNNYIGPGNQPACETWLISPAINLAASSSPNFSFTSASLFSGPPLQTLVSKDYQSGLPANSTWTVLPASYGLSANHSNSGMINLSLYKSANLRIAFKYIGNSGSGQRWQIDNVWVGE
jgi:hypothetical protein